jgi:hypothetical protein
MVQEVREELGGFKWAARTLTVMSGKNYSWQAVQGLWGHRDKNGFPELHPYTVNGHDHNYFRFDEVREWYKAHHGK